jgi:hypothetical protein
MLTTLQTEFGKEGRTMDSALKLSANAASFIPSACLLVLNPSEKLNTPLASALIESAVLAAAVESAPTENPKCL